MHEDFMKHTNLRLYHLERNHYIHLQYGRRDIVEISGIPAKAKPEALKGEVIEFFKEVKVHVN